MGVQNSIKINQMNIIPKRIKEEQPFLYESRCLNPIYLGVFQIRDALLLNSIHQKNSMKACKYPAYPKYLLFYRSFKNLETLYKIY